MPKIPPILDPSVYDLNHVIADLEEIRRYNPQRYEMEQLTAVVYEDVERRICVGYRDLAPNEFWVRGHMPGAPLMPGVMMCEAAAQLTTYFCFKHWPRPGQMVGFGGLENVRFRGVVRPGERFVIQIRVVKFRTSMLVSDFQCLVANNIVCEGQLMGVILPKDLGSPQPTE